MEEIANIGVLFIAGFGPILRDAAASRKLYNQTLGIAFKEEKGGYLHTEALKGAKTFALWPLTQAAQSCYGKDAWPSDVPIPQAWLEFDVDNVETATAMLEARGYRMLVKNKKEPWGQTSAVSSHRKGYWLGSPLPRRCGKTNSAGRDQNDARNRDVPCFSRTTFLRRHQRPGGEIV